MGKNDKNDLVFLKSNYCFLSTTIDQLQTKGLALTQSIGIVEMASEKINDVKGEKAEIFKVKLNNILTKNKGFETLKSI